MASPIIGPDETIYVGSHDDRFYALTCDGKKKWEFATGGDIAGTAAIAADGTIYVGSDDGKLYALTSDGKLKWAFTTGLNITNSPTIGTDGTVYIGSGDKKFYAIKGSSPLANSAWPMYRHDLQHTGRAALAVSVPGAAIAVTAAGKSEPVTSWWRKLLPW